MYRREYMSFLGAITAGIQKHTKRALVIRILVDIRNAELGLPEEGVVCAFEYLPLLGNGFLPQDAARYVSQDQNCHCRPVRKPQRLWS